jgi:hypothetical protein
MANPTIGATTPRIQYTATASQTVFTVPFEFLANADLAVYVNGTLKTLTTDYTLTGANTTGGGTLTFVTGRTAGEIVTILSNLAYSRDTNKYTKYGLLPAEVLEADFDAMQVQSKQLARDGQFALRAPLTDTGTPDMVLPAKATRATKVLGFDSDGDPVASSSTVTAMDAAVTAINTIAGATAGSSAGISHIASGTGAVVTTVQAKLRETVSVKDFGAVGDGVTNDTAAFQAAIDSGAKEVVIPSGTYALGSYINVSSVDGLTIRGVGSPVLFEPSGKTTSSALNVSFFKFTSCSNVTIAGLKIDGNRSAYATVNTYFANADNFRVLWIVGCTNVVVQDCIFENWQGVVVKVVALGATGGATIPDIRADAALPGCNGLKIIGNKFSYCGTPVQVNPSSSYNIYVQNNTIFNTDYSAVTIYPHGYGVFVQDNTMVEVGLITTGPLLNDGYAVRYYECAGGVISGNQIDKCDWGIVLLYGTVDFVPRNISILNNVIIDTSQNVSSSGGAICVTGDNIEIDGNIVGETSTAAKYIGVELEGRNISFSNNVVTYSPSGAGYSFRVGYDSLHGTTNYDCNNINITNNRITVTSGVYGILLNPSATVSGVYVGANNISGQSGAEVYDPNKVVVYEITGSKDTAAPTAGTWKRGDIVYNSTPSAGSVMGWVCVTAGTPGTWVPFAGVQPANAYTVTNPSTDRDLNVSTDTTAQVAAVLGTLIADLQANGVLK